MFRNLCDICAKNTGNELMLCRLLKSLNLLSSVLSRDCKSWNHSVSVGLCHSIQSSSFVGFVLFCFAFSFVLSSAIILSYHLQF